jgi:glycosyltransferase involved in cell wall biosynthesis
MDDPSTLLTVILVTYNHVDSIARALDSVLEQETTYPYKIWLCDDCSTDGTAALCEEYARRYPDRIELFLQPENTYNKPDKTFHGLTALMNIKSKYLTILEGDDTWCDKNKVQIALDVLENNPEYVTFGHDTLFNIIPTKEQKSLVHDVHKAELTNPVYFEQAPLLHTSARIHRNVIKFPENLTAADLYVFYMYMDKGPLYYYDGIMSVSDRTGKGAWTKLTPEEKIRDASFGLDALNRYFNYKYDAFFSSKLATSSRFERLKKILGKRLAWEIWAIYKFHARNHYRVENPRRIKEAK